MKKNFIVILLAFVFFCGLDGAVWADLSDGLVAHYPFNGNTVDETGNGHDGTIVGTTLTADRFGVMNSAYSFAGNDYIKINDHDDFNLNSLTISAWFKTNSLDGIQNTHIEQVIFDKKCFKLSPF